MRSWSVSLLNHSERAVKRVVSLGSLANAWDRDLNFLVPVRTSDELTEVQALIERGLSNLTPIAPTALSESISLKSRRVVVGDEVDIIEDDVVVIDSLQSRLQVLHRRDDRHHSLFLTNRCNSNCLMCSQPPTRHDDSWLVGEALEHIRHISEAPKTIGITGGEPLLCGAGFRRVVDELVRRFPHTKIEVLTNGRLLADRSAATPILDGLSPNVSWLVPLYGHADFLHDFVVQSHGAFDETLAGLLMLQEHRQPIQLRTVLIEPVLENLPKLCEFIGMNLPFVRAVALMGCEPIGFALANRAQCEVDLGRWHIALEMGLRMLDWLHVPALLMNMPMCAVPSALRGYARQSISDWKQVYANECGGCLEKDRCCGLFSWHDRGWKPAPLTPIREVASS
ncbi:MAG: His-Xaa-Ser system radical SAM maturase HxsC [Rhodocyclaceae bacterium]